MTNRLIPFLLALSALLVTACFWWPVSEPLIAQGSPESIIAAGRLLGIVAAFLFLAQVLLISRAKWIEPLFGFDRLTRVHHLIGAALPIIVLAHAILLTLGYAQRDDAALFEKFKDFLENWDEVDGAFAAEIILLCVWILSLNPLRSMLRYQTWYTAHLALYAAWPLALSHQLETGPTAQANKPFAVFWFALFAFAALNALYYRFLLPLCRWHRHRFVVARVQGETNGVISVYIRSKELQMLPFRPGQFVIVRFLTRQFVWEAHPFSVSGMPADGLLRLSIKAVGDYTAKLAQLAQNTKVLIDGPHGVFCPADQSPTKILHLAAGIGITPIRTIIEALAASPADQILLYGNRSTAEIVFKEELESFSRRGRLRIHHILSREAAAGCETGHLNAEIVKRLVPDFRDRDIFLCGPPAMMRELIQALQALGVKRSALHYERFSL